MRNVYIGFDELLNDLIEVDYRAIVMCGLPGSGKSYLGEKLQDEYGWKYLSSDQSRVEILKLTVGKFAKSSEYVNYKSKVYEYMRKVGGESLKNGRKVVFDATHLNEQREILLDYLMEEIGLKEEEVLIVYVDAGDKENVRKRFEVKEGKNADGRSWVERWETAYDFFLDGIESGEITIPKDLEKGAQVVWVQNY